MLPRPTIEAFDRHLASLGLTLEAVVVGGSALALLDVISRETRDFDIVAPVLSADLEAAAKDFAALQRQAGIPLRDGWLNNGPAQLIALAPTSTELAEALPWVASQDGHHDWPAHVTATFGDLGRRLGHVVP